MDPNAVKSSHSVWRDSSDQLHRKNWKNGRGYSWDPNYRNAKLGTEIQLIFRWHVRIESVKYKTKSMFERNLLDAINLIILELLFIFLLLVAAMCLNCKRPVFLLFSLISLCTYHSLSILIYSACSPGGWFLWHTPRAASCWLHAVLTTGKHQHVGRGGGMSWEHLCLSLLDTWNRFQLLWRSQFLSGGPAHVAIFSAFSKASPLLSLPSPTLLKVQQSKSDSTCLGQMKRSAL